MNIGKLEQHCGNCSVVEYCAEPFGSLCICTREELTEVEESTYRCMAENIQSTNKRKISNKKLCDRICKNIQRAQKN